MVYAVASWFLTARDEHPPGKHFLVSALLAAAGIAISKSTRLWPNARVYLTRRGLMATPVAIALLLAVFFLSLYLPKSGAGLIAGTIVFLFTIFGVPLLLAAFSLGIRDARQARRDCALTDRPI
jgi:hypothetical protein